MTHATISCARAPRTLLAVVAMIAAAVALLTAGSTSATAAIAPSTPDSYRGWAYASYPNNLAYTPTTATITTIPAWRWSATGWRQEQWGFGTSFYAYPMATGWKWAYRGGAWFALRSNSYGVWQCMSQTPELRVPTTQNRFAVHRYNASSSEALGYVGPGSTVTQLCANAFPDASENPNTIRCMAIGCGPDRFVLVRAVTMPGCVFPETPNDPICMIAMPIGGFPAKVGYLRLSETDYWSVFGN